MTERTCGTCKLCCKVMPIAALDKPAGPWCDHARPGNGCQGCSIYTDRPEDCSSFACAWLTTPQLGDEMRPDRIGVVITNQGKMVAMFCAAKDQHTVWRKPDLMRLVGSLLQTDHNIMLTDGNRVSMFVRNSPSTWTLSEMRSIGQDGNRQLVEPVRVLASGRFS